MVEWGLSTSAIFRNVSRITGQQGFVRFQAHTMWFWVWKEPWLCAHQSHEPNGASRHWKPLLQPSQVLISTKLLLGGRSGNFIGISIIDLSSVSLPCSYRNPSSMAGLISIYTNLSWKKFWNFFCETDLIYSVYGVDFHSDFCSLTECSYSPCHTTTFPKQQENFCVQFCV